MTHTTLHAQMNPFAQKRAEKQREVVVWMNVLCLSVLVVFSFLYITKTSALSTRGYQIADLEKQQTTLERETQKLEVKIAQERSLDRVLARMNGMGMVPLESIAYASTVPNTLVALR